MYDFYNKASKDLVILEVTANPKILSFTSLPWIILSLYNCVHLKGHPWQFQQDSGISSTSSPELWLHCYPKEYSHLHETVKTLLYS